MDNLSFVNTPKPAAAGDVQRSGHARSVPIVAAEASAPAQASAPPSLATTPTTTKEASGTAAPAQPTTDSLHAALEQIGSSLDPKRHSLSFEINEESGHTVVSVYDAETEELVRQIPPKELLRIATVMQEITEQREQRIATGLLLDEQA